MIFRITTLFLLFMLYLPAAAFSAVGCDLNDPDRDVARLFPGSTGYTTRYASIDKAGGEKLLRQVEARLGDRFRGIYETIDVPYTIYEIHNGKKTIGYIHGVNQKGEYGGIQVFVALDTAGTIRSFYIQKMTSSQGKKLRDASFGKQLVGLDLHDFAQYDPTSGKGAGKVAQIKNPAPDAESDFRAVLRGLKKNLILMDVFVFSAGRK